MDNNSNIKVFEISSKSLEKFYLKLSNWKTSIPNEDKKYRVIAKFQDRNGNIINFHENSHGKNKAVLITNNFGKVGATTMHSHFYEVFYEKSGSKKSFYSTKKILGSDEVGKSDYFGPIIVTSVSWKKDKVSLVLGKDSKEIGFNQSLEDAYNQILKHCMVSSLIFSPIEWVKNEKIRGWNLNEVLTYLHLSVSKENFSKIKKSSTKMVVDDFTNQNLNSQQKYLKKNMESFPELRKFVQRDIESIEWIIKADKKVEEVRLASIVSKYLFWKEMEKIQYFMNKYIAVNSFKLLLGNSIQTKNYILEAKNKGVLNDFLRSLIKPIYWSKFGLLIN